MTLLPDPSDEPYLKGLYKNSLEGLVSGIIDLKSFLPISPSPVSCLRETQLTAYRRAEKLRSATGNRILPRIDMYL